MEELNVSPSQIEGVLLAGAFGSNLRPESVKGIGMFPAVDVDRVKPVGNAAGTGGIMALLSENQLQLAEELPGRVEHVELSIHSAFSGHYSGGVI